MNCPENQYNLFYPSHPGGGGVPGGGWGVKISKVRSISWTVEKIDKRKFTPPPKGVAVGILGGQKSRKCHELSRKSINLFLPIPPGGGFQGGGGGWGLKFQKSGKFHELSRKSIKKFTPPPTEGGRSGNLGGQKIKSPENVMNCPENQYNLFLPIPPGGGGGVPGGGLGGSTFQKSGQFHELSRKSITRKFTPHQRGSQWEF